MAVIVQNDIVVMPWRRGGRQSNAAYPSVRWLAYTQATGDATGGAVDVEALLERSSKLTSRLFTVEDIKLRRLDNTADNVQIAVIGLDQLISGSSPLVFAVEALIQGGTTISRTGLSRGGRYLGQPMQHRPGANLSLFCTFNTNTNTVIYEMLAWGWIWDATAFETPTGPLKPWA